MTTTHRIPAEHFDGLARGGGGRGAIELLRRGQLSKRILALCALTDRAADELPAADAAYTSGGFSALASVQDAAPEVVAAVIADPQVGAWAARCLSGGPFLSDACHLGSIAAAAAVRAHADLRLRVMVGDGGLMLPGVGWAEAPAGPVTVTAQAGSLIIDTDTERLSVSESSVPVAGWQPLRRLEAETDGAILSVLVDDIDPRRRYPGLHFASRLDDATLAVWRRVLQEAWHLLVQEHPEAATELSAGLMTLVPLADPMDGHGVSATAVNAFGAAALSLPADPVVLAEALVHEFQHSKLSALLDLVPLYDPRSHELLYAPWRDDPRPLGGLLQGTYAFLGVTGFWRRQRHTETGSDRANFAHFEFARWREQGQRAAEVLMASDALTPAGERFVGGILTELGGWKIEAVPEAAAVAAREAAADHELTWRIRNIESDSAEIVEISIAWISGLPAPLFPAPGNVHTATAFSEPPNGRLSLLHLRLRDPERLRTALGGLESDLPHISAGDRAYTDGRDAEAVKFYSAEIGSPTASAHAWAGLLLLRQRRRRNAEGAPSFRRPELLRAVYDELISRDQRPDPSALADWLDAADSFT